MTLTVTNFRSWTSSSDSGYVDATTALLPHADVALIHQKELPTLWVGKAVDIDLTLASLDGESYTPLAVIFQQEENNSGVKNDPDGQINFAQSRSGTGSLTIHNKFIQQDDDGQYKFSVVIQRNSDGEIGIIDPRIVNKPGPPP